MIKPIVLIRIDENSRLTFLQSDGVLVASVDYRVDPIVTLWPEQNQALAINAAIDGLPLLSPSSDDAVRSATAAIDRFRRGITIVTTGPRILTKLGEPV